MKRRSWKLSAIVLAGGKSARMGSDKAFLKLNGRYFVSIVTEKLEQVSDDIIVAIGSKPVGPFKRALDPSVRIIKDVHDLGSPVSGIMSAVGQVKHPFVAIVACDLPLLKPEVITFLAESCIHHSAAVPVWPNGGIEPLCSVYDVPEAKKTLLEAIRKFGRIGPRHIVLGMKNVNYVGVSKLRKYDERLESLFNINSRKDYSMLLARAKKGEGLS